MRPEEAIKKIKTVAVVGASRNPSKDAGMVPAYLKKAGFKIIPINPKADEILGEKVYRSLLDIPKEIAEVIDTIQVFRPSAEAERIVEDVIKLSRSTGRKYIVWFQYGTHTTGAIRKALDAGLDVVYNSCMMETHMKAVKSS